MIKKFKNVCQHTKEGEVACLNCRFPRNPVLMNKGPFFHSVSKIELISNYDAFLEVAGKYIIPQQ